MSVEMYTTNPIFGPRRETQCSIVDHALQYARTGLRVFPLQPADKKPHIKQYHQTASTDPDTIRGWWEKWPDSLIGHAIDEQVVVLDIDPRHNGHQTWDALGPDIDASRRHCSGRGDGGIHHWYLCPEGKLSISGLNAWAEQHGVGEPIINKDGRQVGWNAGIDLLTSRHRYTILPPSPHPVTGNPYWWDSEDDPDELPARLVELLQAPKPPKPKKPHVDYGGDSPADWYTDNHTWNEILDLHGWTVVNGDGDEDGSLWRHPDATATHSASIKYGCLFVYSPRTVFDETTDDETNGYTRFAAYSLLNHGGDQSAAASEVRRTMLSDRPSEPPPNVDGNGEFIDNDEPRQIPTEWTPVDLLPAWRGDKPRPSANVLRRTDGVVCFPPGIGYIFGDSGDGKSWVEMIAALEQIRLGNDVVWLSYEDPSEDEIVHRLRLMGATEDELAHLHVIIATEALTDGVWHVARLCRRVQATLLVIDSVGEVLAVEGLNEDRDNEFGPWARNTLRELYDRVTTEWDDAEGSLPVQSFTIKPIDHATKAKDNRHYASGSKRKRAMVTGLAVSVIVRQPFGVGQIGRVQLICAKDRSGRFRRGEIVAEIKLDATVTPYHWSVDAPQAGAAMTGTKKRNATERVLQVIADANVPVTADEVTRIANSNDHRMPGEAELKPGTVRNTLGKLTGITKKQEPTGTGAGYRITYGTKVVQ